MINLNLGAHLQLLGYWAGEEPYSVLPLVAFHPDETNYFWLWHFEFGWLRWRLDFGWRR